MMVIDSTREGNTKSTHKFCWEWSIGETNGLLRRGGLKVLLWVRFPVPALNVLGRVAQSGQSGGLENHKASGNTPSQVQILSLPLWRSSFSGLERPTEDREVVGSNPTFSTSHI